MTATGLCRDGGNQPPSIRVGNGDVQQPPSRGRPDHDRTPSAVDQSGHRWFGAPAGAVSGRSGIVHREWRRHRHLVHRRPVPIRQSAAAGGLESSRSVASLQRRGRVAEGRCHDPRVAYQASRHASCWGLGRVGMGVPRIGSRPEVRVTTSRALLARPRVGCASSGRGICSPRTTQPTEPHGRSSARTR